VNVAHLFLLERVIVGGGVSQAGDVLLDPARQFFLQHAAPVVAETCDIVATTLGDQAGILGAALGASQGREAR
jgi:glucokinase